MPTDELDPVHGFREGETPEEKAEEMADMVGEANSEAAQEVKREAESGTGVQEEQLEDLEIKVAAAQSQETLLENGALETADDLAHLHHSRVEEIGIGPTHTVSLLEGDILPASEEQRALLEELTKGQLNGTLKSRGGVGEPWTNGRIPYCFADVSQNIKDVFRAAVHVISDALPCLVFEEVAWVKGDSSSTEPWEGAAFDPANEAECAEQPAIFVKSNRQLGCYSALGVIAAWKSQAVQLQDPGCAHLGTVIHELGHALGMHHEHQRPDRERFIKIHDEHIKPEAKAWFHTNPDVDVLFPYQHLSIMHYSCKAFSRDGEDTITLLDGSCHETGARGSLAYWDAVQLESLYKPMNPECKVNARTGLGCEDKTSEVDCSKLRHCDQAARTACCACGGGIVVQCYEDRPCPTHELKAGSSLPYDGFLASDGTLDGGWYLATVEDGLAHCLEVSCCLGITLAEPPEAVQTGKHWMMLKNHFNMGGDTGCGWTSFRLPAPPTPAPTPMTNRVHRANSAVAESHSASRRQLRRQGERHQHQRRQSGRQRRSGRGQVQQMQLQPGHYIVGGGEMYGAYMTLSEAQTTCMSDPVCQGFTWKGGRLPSPDGPVSVIFANKTRHFAGAGWNSYIKAS